MKTILVRKSINKNGGARYGLPGVRTSSYFPPTMFQGEPPEQLEVEEPAAQAQGPDGPLVENGEPVMKGTVFATETTQRRGGTTSGVKVNAELQKAREEAKRLREESKKVLKEARARIKAGRKAGTQPPLVDAGEPATV